MLQLSHVKKLYNKTEVFADVDFTFETGRLYPVLGGLGSGRTTLLECICEDMPIDGGQIRMDVNEDIGYAAKQSVLPLYVTGYEFIKFLCELKKKSKEPDYYLERVAMSEESMNKLICDYNFEEKKRLQLAAFLVQKPYVMLFDEPVDYCSQEFIDTFIDVLEEEKDRHIIIVTTALLDIATHVADDILVLSNGEINEVTKEMLEITEIKHAILDILGEEENDIL